MKKKPILFILCVIFCLLLFTGCNNAPSQNATARIDDKTDLAPSSTPTTPPTPTLTPIPAPIQCDIAFESDRDGNLEIYRMEPDGNNLINLTKDQAEDFDPVWSPDGSQIAFVSNRDNGEVEGQFIYLMDADGSNVRQLSFEENCRMPDWSHDGTHITYNSNDDIYIIEVEGKKEGVNLTNSPDRDVNPEWSPDGNYIVWSSSTDGENWHVFIMNADGSNKKQLTHEGIIYNADWTVDNRIFVGGWDSAEYGSGNFLISPDGSEIISAGGKGEVEQLIPFFTKDNSLVGCVSGTVNNNNEEIYLVGEIYDGWFFNLTNNDGNDRNPSWPANCILGKTARVEGEETEAPIDFTLPEISGNVVLGYTGNQDTMSPIAEEDLLKACHETGMECIKKDSISELVDLDVDVILSFSNRFNALGDNSAIQDALAKGIITIILNAETPVTGAYNLSIDTDSTQKSIEWMISEMGGSGKIIFYPGSSICQVIREPFIT